MYIKGVFPSLPLSAMTTFFSGGNNDLLDVILSVKSVICNMSILHASESKLVIFQFLDHL